MVNQHQHLRMILLGALQAIILNAKPRAHAKDQQCVRAWMVVIMELRSEAYTESGDASHLEQCGPGIPPTGGSWLLWSAAG